ncbi:MAG: hypothetical protein DRQ13_09640 [Ignavibacteriae bacterium]|nr:MAG: hypothetical protein DRQ13_09640 [Ignavibacteriota bacterium]
MNYSKIATKLHSKISKFSGYVSTKLDKTAKRFITESIYGIISSQSVLLTEIGRSIETKISLKKTEDRYCRQLNKPELWNSIEENILQLAAPKIKQETLLILDLGDIHKKYAESMEYITYVRDGSDDGKIVKGYWTNQVIAAELDSMEVIPLYSDLYSQDSPDFLSENTEIIKAIDMVSKQTENRGIWVIDRGGDRDVLYSHFLAKQNEKRFIVRLIGNRNLLCGNKKQLALELANQTKCPYSETVVKEENGKEKLYHISYGYRKVRVPNYPEKEIYMLVVKGFGEKPMMLLTTEKLARNFKVLQRLLHSYLKRWAIEQTIRFIKQNYDLENIRVLKYVRLKNMMALLLAVFYFIAVVLDGAQKLKVLVGHILKQAKRIFGTPSFHYYAVGDGLSAIFKRAPQKVIVTDTYREDQLKFCFKIT